MLGPAASGSQAFRVLQNFLSPATPSLKICGITRAADALRLADLGVDALGVNFWPKSKRFLDPADAGFLAPLKGRILRVGVFVNAEPELPRSLVEQGLLDAVQLHGDEPEQEILDLKALGIPCIRALGIATAADLNAVASCPANAILLDAHAPGIYGGTGQTIDWTAAAEFITRHPQLSVILAGGITPDNAAQAAASVHPAALDTASGSESAPGIKDFDKVTALLNAIR